MHVYIHVPHLRPAIPCCCRAVPCRPNRDQQASGERASDDDSGISGALSVNLGTIRLSSSPSFRCKIREPCESERDLSSASLLPPPASAIARRASFQFALFHQSASGITNSCTCRCVLALIRLLFVFFTKNYQTFQHLSGGSAWSLS